MNELNVLQSEDMQSRDERINELVQESHEILDRAIEEHITAQNRTVAGTCVLFSGGNDSTALAHIFKDRATHAIHANTTVGIEETRQYVRNTCRSWGLPLLEYKPPRETDHYESLVLAHGFPGPGHHFKMYQRLKERGLHAARKELVKHPFRERVIFLAGRRRQESKRRTNVPESERTGSIVWVSPLVHWSKLDLAHYRQMHDVPRNQVTDLLHMSGECLCLSFAHPGEREEIALWYPEFYAWIEELEAKIVDREDIPEQRRKWGWGASKQVLEQTAKNMPKSGPLCTTCDARMEAALNG